MRASDQFIIEEVKRQGWDVETFDGACRVHWMRAAWVWAEVNSRQRARPTVDDILALSYFVEPVVNKDGYRQIPVFPDGRAVMDWRSVPAAMDRFMENSAHLSPLRFYFEFESIHPFEDGNGRVGAILYNWMSGTLAEPVAPEVSFAEGVRAALSKFPYLAPRIWGTEERHAAMNYPIQGADEEVGYVANPAFDMHWLSLVARLSAEGKAPTTEIDFVGYIFDLDEDVGEHDCDEPDCRSRHNCGVTGVDIDSEWNLCTGCASAADAEDADAAEMEAQLDAEDDLEACCAPWWEPCCTKDGRPL